MSKVQESVRRDRGLPLFAHGGEAGSALPIAFGHGSDPAGVHADVVPAKEYVFFDSQEAAFVEAAVDTLIPPDHLGPGALELGVAAFIDRQLSELISRSYHGARKAARTKVILAPRVEWTPSALIKTGIANVNAFCRDTCGASFAELRPRQRAEVLAEVECGEAELAIVPNATFFSLLLELTVQGYLAAPIHDACERVSPAGRVRRRSPRKGTFRARKRLDRKDTASTELAQ
jgi:gluconate 2-dehydrogenase gamma chain